MTAPPIVLHVNIDHVATLRQARGTPYPDPVWAASLCELAGAHGITVHLREDRRHIQDRDVELLRKTVRGTLNLEMAATEEMIAIATSIRPDVVTLVPEKRAEQTTEGGLALSGPSREPVARTISALARANIAVSLFIDPTAGDVESAKALGAGRIELHTGDYCNAKGGKVQTELARIREAAAQGARLGLHVAAGHGLDYGNVGPIAALREIEELNIGHALVARAVLHGIDRAVRDMIEILHRARA